MAEQKSKKITLRFTEEEFRELDGKRAAMGKKFQVLGEELFLAQWLRQGIPLTQAHAAQPAWPECPYPASHQKYHEQLEKLLLSDDPPLFDGIIRLLDSLASLASQKALPKPAVSIPQTEDETVCSATG